MQTAAVATMAPSRRIRRCTASRLDARRQVANVAGRAINSRWWFHTAVSASVAAAAIAVPRRKAMRSLLEWWLREPAFRLGESGSELRIVASAAGVALVDVPPICCCDHKILRSRPQRAELPKATNQTST